MVTIEEAKIAQMALQQSIALAMKKFTDETGLKVDSITANPIVTLGGRVSYYSVEATIYL